ncbi:hypothetical protein ACFU99_00415 [Streptomyces sp. NPDC057654]|uniref:hypothetical protein n=1 Tax=Streptomyces sp. NPDC057654 TaxID=3346196 RepID=UPI00367B8BA1
MTTPLEHLAVANMLTGRSVQLSLQEIAEDLGGSDPAHTPLDASEAHALIEALLRAGGRSSEAAAAALEGVHDPAAARRLLAELSQDAETAQLTAAVLADPPTDEQMSVEHAVAAAVLLGALVSWLQTKVDIEIKRTEGKTEFRFRLTKQPASAGLLRDLARLVSRILSGPPQ